MAKPKRQRRSSAFWQRPAFWWWTLGAALVLLVVFGGSVYASSRLEEDDAFCASCHTEPEVTYFNRTQTPSAVDLASFHHGETARCIDCHSGPGVDGRLNTIMTLGVRDLVLYATHQAKQPAPLTQLIPDANCLKCHEDVPQTRSFDRHFHAFLSRWQAQDSSAATCVDCHSSHTTDGQANLGYLQEVRTEAVCNRCHRSLGD